jgi:hypothetical protein
MNRAMRAYWAAAKWTGRRGDWWLAVAGLSIANIAYAVNHPGAIWGWAAFGAGLAMTAIRPVGTGLYRRAQIRECEAILAQVHQSQDRLRQLGESVDEIARRVQGANQQEHDQED